METLRLIMVTIPKDEAAAMARGLVESKLAACVNIIGDVNSYFFWQGAVQNDKESLLFIKSTAVRFEAIKEYVLENHPLELPEIIAIDLSASSEDFAKWVVGETAGNTGFEKG